MGAARFRLGRVVATPGGLEALARVNEEPARFLARHVTGDWGDLDDDDRLENERSIQNGCRLLSAYLLGDGTKIWLITEADRSATTILLPEEY
jgi:hypothetical protein